MRGPGIPPDHWRFIGQARGCPRRWFDEAGGLGLAVNKLSTLSRMSATPATLAVDWIPM